MDFSNSLTLWLENLDSKWKYNLLGWLSILASLSTKFKGHIYCFPYLIQPLTLASKMSLLGPFSSSGGFWWRTIFGSSEVFLKAQHQYNISILQTPWRCCVSWSQIQVELFFMNEFSFRSQKPPLQQWKRNVCSSFQASHWTNQGGNHWKRMWALNTKSRVSTAFSFCLNMWTFSSLITKPKYPNGLQITLTQRI